MGTYVTASYEVKCRPDEAFYILSYIDKVNGMHDFSFKRNQIGKKGVLKAAAWARRICPVDSCEEINLCRKLTRKYPGTRIWLHLCVEYGNYEFYDYLFSNGEIEGGFSYDDNHYKRYSHELRKVEEEGYIENQEDTSEVSATHPTRRMKKEFYKIQEGDVMLDD